MNTPIKLKKKKEFEKCDGCQKDLTGKISLVEDKKYCYKCFVQWRIEDRARQAREEKEWITNWIRLKKYLCPRCKVRLNDLGVCFGWDIVCLKCGEKVIKLKVKEPKQMQPNLE